jgi:hypothetical protein
VGLPRVESWVTGIGTRQTQVGKARHRCTGFSGKRAGDPDCRLRAGRALGPAYCSDTICRLRPFGAIRSGHRLLAENASVVTELSEKHDIVRPSPKWSGERRVRIGLSSNTEISIISGVGLAQLRLARSSGDAVVSSAQISCNAGQHPCAGNLDIAKRAVQ